MRSRRSKFVWQILLAILLATGFAGCATDDQQPTSVPWTRRKDWEGGFGAMGAPSRN
jgi:hypothetical protein